jgi:non-ribosomal peptide synthetase component F/acyl carrier protein
VSENSAWLFEALDRWPSAGAAIEAGSGIVSYGELRNRVAGIAERMVDSAAPMIVPLLGERGDPGTVVRLLATWKSGRIPLLLSAAASAATVAAITERITAEAPDSLKSSSGAGAQTFGDCPDPAYIVPTSGSTGTPELVLCRWQGLEVVVPQLIRRYDFGPESRVLQFAACSYDAYLAETIPVLWSGGTLICCDGARWTTPRRVAETLRSQQTTHATFPPSYLAELLRIDTPFELEVLVSAGEALHPHLARRARTRCQQLVNAYGPCEATICATTYTVAGDEDAHVPIGTPLEHVRLRVRDGLLEIQGPTVAWGYIGGRRASAFYQDDGIPTFRTADLVEAREGQYIHLERADRRRKIAGELVDLDGIEETLRAIPEVTAAAVLERGGDIAAIVVTAIPLTEVQSQAQVRLTPGAFPRHWVVVDKLPRLDSDKIDYTLLSSHFDRPLPRAIPTNWLRALWQLHVLRAESSGDFFTQGGTSLTAMELLDAIYEKSGAEIDLADFLTEPTFENLARLVNEQCAD